MHPYYDSYYNNDDIIIEFSLYEQTVIDTNDNF